MGTFFERVEALKARIGDGDLVGRLVVDQPYALYQHETFGLNHPRGGGPKFLSGPFERSAPAYMEELADSVLNGSLIQTMAQNLEDLSFQLDPAAPIDADPNFYRLRLSGNPIVTDDGTEVYNRPPFTPRQPPGHPGT